MNDQEQIMSVLAQGYQMLALAMEQKPSKEGFQLILLMLGDDGIQACVQVADQGPEAVAKTMAQVIQEKQTLMAARGAKLSRLMALSNRCPEGYMKRGGKCKKCEKGNKVDPTKGVFHVAAYFLNGSKISKYLTAWGTLKPGLPEEGHFSEPRHAYGQTREYLAKINPDFKVTEDGDYIYYEHPGIETQLGYQVKTYKYPKYKKSPNNTNPVTKHGNLAGIVRDLGLRLRSVHK